MELRTLGRAFVAPLSSTPKTLQPIKCRAQVELHVCPAWPHHKPPGMDAQPSPVPGQIGECNRARMLIAKLGAPLRGRLPLASSAPPVCCWLDQN